jgi:adenylate kinase
MIIVFGPAGAGKSVQSKLLAKAKNWKWLSAGQLLRDTNKKDLQETLLTGKLVPADDINLVMAKAFKEAANVDRVILDGFPRQMLQAKWLIEKSPFHGHSVSAVVVIDIDKDEVLKRLTLRGRADDTPSAIEERLEIYHTKIKPVIEYFASQNVEIIYIDGDGTIDQVHNRIMEKLKACNLNKK